jgi:hypothetical protein
MFYRYSSALNSLRPSAQFASVQPQVSVGVSSVPSSCVSPVLIDSNVSMSALRASVIARSSAVNQVSRNVSTTPKFMAAAVQVVDNTGPGSAPYGDPNMMLGRDGKLIPKLPKGTVVGSLVMGEHGMFNPKVRAHQLEALKVVGHGGTHFSTPASRFRYHLGLVLTVFCTWMFGVNLYMISSNNMLFPYNVIYTDPKKK